MKAIVCVKQVLDATVPLRLAEGVVTQDTPWPIRGIGGAERAALEQAITWRGTCGGTLTAVSLGGQEAEEALRFCLARGADSGALGSWTDPFDPASAGRALARWVRDNPVDLIWCGGASGDGAAGFFPAVVAAELDWPLVTAVAAVTGEPDGRLRLERRLERGDREMVRCSLPAVLAVEASAAEPRYVSLRALRAAERLAIETFVCEDAAREQWELVAIEPAKPRPKRVSGPDARLSAMDRLGHLLGGGMQQKQSGGFVEGAPETVAAEIVRFLEEKGFVRGAG